MSNEQACADPIGIEARARYCLKYMHIFNFKYEIINFEFANLDPSRLLMFSDHLDQQPLLTWIFTMASGVSTMSSLTKIVLIMRLRIQNEK